MEKRMEPVSVSTKSGSVWIKQNYDSGEDGIVVVDPSQVPTLVQWLQEAAAELELEERSTALTGEAAAAR
jgi:hypothetical protein